MSVPPSSAVDPAEATPPSAAIENHVGHLLRRAYAIARNNSARALAPLGDVSPVQASVLTTLAAGSLTQAELGRAVGMEPANIHTLVRRMIGSGLIVLTADPDNSRLTRVSRTDHGSAIAGKLGALLASSADATLAGLSVEERHLLIALLQRIVRSAAPRATRPQDEQLAPRLQPEAPPF